MRMVWITPFLQRPRPAKWRSVRLRSLVLPVRLGTASGLLRRPASAKLLLCSRTLPVLAPPPFWSPQKSSFFVWGAAPTCFSGARDKRAEQGETYVPHPTLDRGDSARLH